MHLVTIVLALLSAGARADLPIHCLRKWIHGDWVMRRSAMRSGGVAQCGYVAPDNNAQHFSQNHKFHYESSGEEMHLSLRSPNLVECTKGCEKGKHLGNFTMTYDEGMEIQMPDMVFYAFFKYTPKSNVDPEVTDSLKHYDSDCSKTRTGWIHEQAVKPDKWGCASMEQIRGVSPQEKCVTVQDTLTADQPALLNGEIDVAGNYSTTSEPRFRGKVSSRTSKACLGAAAALVEKAGAGVQQTAILEVDQNARFTYDRKWIEKHNSDPEALWTATAYDKFEGMQLKEAMNRLGSQRAKVIPHRHHHHGKAASSSSSLSSTTTDSSSTSSIVDLPKSFDWRQKGIETAVQDQGNCGSCYAQAALDVAAMRYRIQKPNMEPLTFSVDDHIDTSFYNQGCSGGYPYLVGKHGKDLGFRTVKCYQENKNCDERHFIKGYGYVGGYYGGGNMESIMREIHDKGPVIAAFEPSGTFFSYKSGIFTGAKGPHTDDWEKTDHAIVLIGWGETTDGVKYWIGKNSWGSEWGDNGYFKIRRGTDETGVESMAVHLDF